MFVKSVDGGETSRVRCLFLIDRRSYDWRLRRAGSVCTEHMSSSNQERWEELGTKSLCELEKSERRCFIDALENTAVKRQVLRSSDSE